MIRSITIKGLRGIRSGTLEGLTPVVVLVGPNNSGKSTVLDAIFLGASLSPDRLQRTLSTRRPGLQQPHRWLLWREGKDELAEAEIVIASDVSPPRRTQITRAYPGNPDMGFQIAVGPATGSDDSEHLTVVAAGGGFGPGPMADASPLKDIPEVRLVDYSVAGDTIPLPELYTRVAESGLLQEAKSIVTDLLPDIENIEILTQQNQPTVYLFYKTGALPTAAAGDGIQVLLRQSLELAAPVGGVVLLEEPELHMHPAAIRQSARAILSAMRRKIQVILATHSLDLIDALLSCAAENELNDLSFYRLQLERGELLTHRSTGTEAALVRTQIQEDLR